MKKVKEGFKKYLKGMFGIFVLKVLLLGVFLIHQACERDDSPNLELQVQAKESFLNALTLSSHEFGRLRLVNSKIDPTTMLNKNSSTLIMLEITNENELDSEKLDNVESVEDIIDIGGVFKVLPKGEYECEGTVPCFGVSLEATEESLQPAVLSAREFLHLREFSDEEIDAMIDEEGGSEEDLVPLVALIIEDEGGSGEPYEFSSVDFFSSTKLYAQSWKDIGRCAAAAIGADIAYALAVEGGGKSDKWKKKAIKKLFGKVAKRFLGPVGAAIAVVSFATCLYAS